MRRLSKSKGVRMPKAKRKPASQARREIWGLLPAGANDGSTRILGLDISSTHVGLCIVYNRDPVFVVTIDLPGADRELRLKRLSQDMRAWMRQEAANIDGIAYEGPAPNAKSGGYMNMVTQAQAIGIVKAAWFEHTAARAYTGVVEVSIQHGKSALAGYYNATKEQMIEAAQLTAPQFYWDEHSADAFGIAMGAYTYLEQQRQVAAYDAQMRRESL